MDAEKKAQWVAALRSKEYEQTTEVLYRRESDPFYGQPKGYCCLGVLTDLAVKDGVGEWGTYRNSKTATFLNSLEHNDSTLPASVMIWCDFNHAESARDEGRIELPLETRDGSSVLFLTGLNDDDKYMDFEKIADLIDYFM